MTEDIELWGACPKETCIFAITKAEEGGWDKGFGMIGNLLAFLIVLRTAIAWGMYWEGRGHIGALVATSRALAIELLTACVHNKDHVAAQPDYEPKPESIAGEAVAGLVERFDTEPYSDFSAK